MNNVRPMEERDLTQVARLYQSIPDRPPSLSWPALCEHLEQVFLRNPWRDERLPSLVFEENGENITGCIGVLPRPMMYNGKHITAAISHSFIVAPERRSSMAAFQLAREFLRGPQDLSLAEGSDVSRKIWQSMGGSTSYFSSFSWTRPLQPSRYALSFMKRRGLSSVVAWVLQPLCRFTDAMMAVLPPHPFRPASPKYNEAELEAPALSVALPRVTECRLLKPRYNPHTVQWLMDTLAVDDRNGKLQKVVVRNNDGETLGWYLYYLQPGGVAIVVQLAAVVYAESAVIDHLFHHAWSRGAIAVSGQVDPALFKPLAEKNCLFHHDGNSWLLVHSHQPEIAQAIENGSAFLSRLDGEWWISSYLG